MALHGVLSTHSRPREHVTMHTYGLEDGLAHRSDDAVNGITTVCTVAGPPTV